MGWTVRVGVVLAFGAFVYACGGDGDDSPAQEDFCEPGVLTFCKCRGDRPGSRQCSASGKEFDACVADDGLECVELPEGGGGEGGLGGTLYVPCAADDPSACAEGTTCQMGYCTTGCDHFTQCDPPNGDCVQMAGAGVCVPRCESQQTCVDQFGPASKCSYAADLLPPASFGFTGCADWTGDPVLPPDGFYCKAGEVPVDDKCHLGVAEAQRICTDEGVCGPGCHTAFDCPSGTACTAGICEVTCDCGDDFCDAACETQATCPQDCTPPTLVADKCPGELIAISVASNTIFINADTSLAPPPAEAKGIDACAPTSTSSEELIYNVLPDQDGDLLLLLEPAANFDAQLYVRAGSCTTGPQIACSDEIGAGVSEIVEVPVNAGEKVTVFVDGFDGSTGTFELQLLLSP